MRRKAHGPLGSTQTQALAEPEADLFTTSAIDYVHPATEKSRPRFGSWWLLSVHTGWHRKAAWGVGLVIVTAIGYSLWPSQQSANPAQTRAESQCIANVSSMFARLLQGRWATSAAELNQLLAYHRTQPQFDAAMAQHDLKDKISFIRFNTAYCQQLAGCSTSRPLKQAFDDCYSAMSDTSDGDSN